METRLQQGQRLRDTGVALVTRNNLAWIKWARACMRQMCIATGGVHIDDIRRLADAMGYQPDSSNAWGAIFRERGWRKTGELRPSVRPSNHGHASPVWVWRP